MVFSSHEFVFLALKYPEQVVFLPGSLSLLQDIETILHGYSFF